MKKWMLFVLMSFAAATGAHARIGESEAQIQKRYGMPYGGNDEMPGIVNKYYHASGLLVMVGFMDGVSTVEFYMKPGKEKLSETEVSVLMNANAGGKQWVKDEQAIALGKRWTLEDGSLFAEWENVVENRLIITTVKAMQHFEKMKAKKETERLKGF